MLENDVKNLDNEELIELLSALEGMDVLLEEEENLLKEGDE